MPRIKLILNPASDKGRTAKIGEALQVLLAQRAEEEKKKGVHYELDWALTKHRRHAMEYSEQAAVEGCDIVVALGGDGTVHEVINGLMKIDKKKRPRLAVIPVGSGNDFAHNFGLPDDHEKAIHCLFGDKTRPVDIGVITSDTGKQVYWDNTLSIGFGGSANIASIKYTWVQGFLVYLLAVLETILTKPLKYMAKVQIDDKPVQERGVAMVSVCNGPREGGGFPVAPDAIMDDGLITYMFMRNVNQFQMLYFLPVVMAAKHLGYTKFFEEGTCKKLTVEVDKAVAIHTDGELYAHWDDNIKKVEMSILPGEIQVMCNC